MAIGNIVLVPRPFSIHGTIGTSLIMANFSNKAAYQLKTLLDTRLYIPITQISYPQIVSKRLPPPNSMKNIKFNHVPLSILYTESFLKS